MLTPLVVLAIFACGSSANDCLRPCPANYDPICCGTAAPSSEPQYTFGNTCALDQWNCENNKSE